MEVIIVSPIKKSIRLAKTLVLENDPIEDSKEFLYSGTLIEEGLMMHSFP